MNIEIKQTAVKEIYDIFSDSELIGRIIVRGGFYMPEPHSTVWAQDEFCFNSQAEAVAFLSGAAWMIRNQGEDNI